MFNSSIVMFLNTEYEKKIFFFFFLKTYQMDKRYDGKILLKTVSELHWHIIEMYWNIVLGSTKQRTLSVRNHVVAGFRNVITLYQKFQVVTLSFEFFAVSLQFLTLQKCNHIRYVVIVFLKIVQYPDTVVFT